MHTFTRRELEIIESLKNRTIQETANHFKVTRSAVDNVLYRVRNKIEFAHGTVNIANNWKDSKRNPRLAKLLRRQTSREEDVDEED